MRQDLKSELSKGLAIKQQLSNWDGLFECRIQIQKILTVQAVFYFERRQLNIITFTIERVINIVCIFSQIYVLNKFTFHFSFRFVAARILILYIFRRDFLLYFCYIVNRDTFSHARNWIYLNLSLWFRFDAIVLEFCVWLAVL